MRPVKVWKSSVSGPVVNAMIARDWSHRVTVGGSYTVIPYTVSKLHWLTKLQMMDGFALAETTPGPLIIVVAFVGFMAGYNHFHGSLWMGTLGLLATT